MDTRRLPAVAGTFYSDDARKLREEIESAFLGPFGPGRLPSPSIEGKSNVVGLVSPHAGYVFSGGAAAFAFAELAEDGVPDVAVIIGPNHRGIGFPVAIMEQGIWETPLGELRIDADIADRLLKSCSYLQADASSHKLEHSLEVQAPFLQYVAGERTRIVPIAVSVRAFEAKAVVADLGKRIAEALAGVRGVVIASTDMTHYESKASAQRKDAMAIEAMKSLDSSRLMDVVVSERITMCGVATAAIVMEACASMGAARAELLQYYTSGDISGDTEQVVGYAAMKIVRG